LIENSELVVTFIDGVTVKQSIELEDNINASDMICAECWISYEVAPDPEGLNISPKRKHFINRYQEIFWLKINAVKGKPFTMSELNIRPAIASDLDRCFEIETVSYTGDEAATKEKILKRIQTYPEGFIVIENKEEIIGFINSGATHKVELTDEEFKELIGHDPSGEHIVIMSVVVHPKYQGKSMASKLMHSFISSMKKLGKTEIYLLCQTELVDMYARYGFIHHGESDSEHGGLSWHEMSLPL